ncbi:hypothetical protein ATI61_101774 [Archangium gephyra]|uniref:Uncharacterized protein n=1 Tax=Archangium gephyra TaxID=48 RepID=A0AAC8QB75_9BACT|nr:hypothetical protein [Archangium gephyra]AKJ04130.1 Hypothetical protein AA314_05756 [Archangium gephyra]REG37787.1 hypothetical protein ATI61_101774 [Archangium gephyra]
MKIQTTPTRAQTATNPQPQVQTPPPATTRGTGGGAGTGGSAQARATGQSTFEGAATTFPAAKPPNGTAKVDVSPQASGRPVVFLNYEESYLQGRLGDSWSRTGDPTKTLQPSQGSFDIAASHTNASQHNVLQVGLEFRNTTDKEVKLTLSQPRVSDLPVYARDPAKIAAIDEAHGRKPLDPDSLVKPPATARALPNGAVELTIPPGASVQVPVGEVGRFPPFADKRTLDFNKTPPTSAQISELRGGKRSIYYELQATVSPPGSLAISDIACHPGGKRQDFKMKDGSPVTPLPHHEGVFNAQRQTQSAPVLLTPGGQRATFQIQGSNDTHDAHYNAQHTYFVAFPANQMPKTLSFVGQGGQTLPKVGDRVLDKLEQPFQDTVNGKTYKHSLTMSFAEALKRGHIKPAGVDATGNKVYRVDVTWRAGDNCSLSLYAR